MIDLKNKLFNFSYVRSISLKSNLLANHAYTLGCKKKVFISV